ncbi:MAG: phytoene/squalene synthase family protein [Alphaproteobacteria bacterium]
MPSTSSSKSFADPADLAACRDLLRDGSRTFLAASRLMPRRVHEPATALYAFCRIADDAVDMAGSHAGAVAKLHERLDRAYEGRPINNPVDRAFADVVAYFDMPREVPEALLEGLAWDVEGRRYETLSDLYAYGARVAGAVGVLMAILMQERSPEALARASDLGVAMQLTNISRDVGEDARVGRLYLPRTWLEEAGIDPDAWLREPVFSDALASVVQRLLDAADVLYKRSEPGIALLPADCRPGIFAARHLYAEIGREVERQGYDSVSSRAVVSGSRKLALLPKAGLAAFLTGASRQDTAPLHETSYLVEAAKQLRPATLGFLPCWNLSGQVLRMADLFAALEKREQQQHYGEWTPATVRIQRGDR